MTHRRLLRRAYALLTFLGLIFVFAPITVAGALWQTLPEPPPMPPPAASGSLEVNGAKIFYASYGAGPVVILLHGGLANSGYWANQIEPLARSHRVIVIDSRGHGQSTRDDKPYSYALLASDVAGVMDALKITKAAFVGWSDGAIVALELTMNQPERVERVFAFAANADTSGVISGGSKSPTFANFLTQAHTRYTQSPQAFASMSHDISRMWANEPNFTAKDLARITVRTTIADGDHDEIIKRSHTEYLAKSIKGAKLIMLPGVSHFAMLQDPAAFNAAVLAFLDEQ